MGLGAHQADHAIRAERGPARVLQHGGHLRGRTREAVDQVRLTLTLDQVSLTLTLDQVSLTLSLPLSLPLPLPLPLPYPYP